MVQSLLLLLASVLPLSLACSSSSEYETRRTSSFAKVKPSGADTVMETQEANTSEVYDHFENSDTPEQVMPSEPPVTTNLTNRIISVPAGNPENENIKVTVEFEVPRNEFLSPIPQFSPLLNISGNSFFVWADLNNRPQITQKKVSGQIVVRPVDANNDYAAVPDSHHGFSIGIDRDGYLHVMGDMHHYPMAIDRVPPLPERYRNQNSMYWISNKPFDISAGFRFAGALKSPSALPASSLSYSRFHHAPNGDLYLTLLVRAHLNPSTAEKAFAPGALGLGLYKYDPTKKSWSAIGNYPDIKIDVGGQKWKVLFWEKSGTGGWFQGFIPGVAFDKKGNIHVAASGNIDPNLAGGTLAFYAMSPDGGKSWKRANGSAIPSLPLRGVASSPSRADVVVDTKGSSFLHDTTRVVVDAKGMPLVWNSGVWRRFDGRSWSDENIYNNKDYIGHDVLLGPDNVLTFLGTYYRMARSASADSKRIIYPYNAIIGSSDAAYIGYIAAPSELGLWTTGAIYAIDLYQKEKMRIIKMTFTPKR